MKEMLGTKWPAFLACYEEDARRGLRVNPRKVSPTEFLRLADRVACAPAEAPPEEGALPKDLRPVPWCDEGFSFAGEVRPSQHPWYAAGLYYLQEPSAMAPAAVLPVAPGMRVLDLCAAPGGKATQLLGRIGPKGVLVANDASLARARALLRNLELFGAVNFAVTAAEPARLAEVFPAWFDAILVDAPCSGEGMFRRDESVAAAWSPARVREFADLQKRILAEAAKMLCPGGHLLYSTCTFSPEEDEMQVVDFLREHGDFSLLPIPQREGFSPGAPDWGGGEKELEKCVRIWPQSSGGEGHFLALFQKDGEPRKPEPDSRVRIERRGDRAFRYTEASERLRSKEARRIEILRDGLFIGEWKKGRFEPSHPLALATDPRACADRIELASGDSRVARFLRGEEIEVSADDFTKGSGPAGWKLVCADGFALGWGKVVGARLKNKIPAGWR